MGRSLQHLLRQHRLTPLHLSSSQLRQNCVANSSRIPQFRYFLRFPHTHFAARRFATFPAISGVEDGAEQRGRWLTLPPYSPPVDVASASPITALKWVRRCCPHLPVNLVHKLFRLRQVRREAGNANSLACTGQEASHLSLKRVSGKEPLNAGDRIHLPFSVEEYPQQEENISYTEDEIDYIRSLELYKDKSIIAVNKPYGLPVQGGVGIKLSMDLLAGACLRYDYKEPPRLVHRLDRESSGVLVLGRTQMSTSLLHTIFREKTLRAADEMECDLRIFRKKYWALVIGRPRHPRGLINAPLRKVTLENRNYEQITVAEHDGQHAATEYEVVESSNEFTWLALYPLTGRKHQLRVHCAETLGTPIVGDLKYGWSRHRKWQPWMRPSSSAMYGDEKQFTDIGSIALAGTNMVGNSILGKRPSLHLHCREMVIPNISCAVPANSVDPIDLVAPLPPHMQRSWDALSFSSQH
ncbi:pseudouridine synthase family protein [Wolffia australiana]